MDRMVVVDGLWKRYPGWRQRRNGVGEAESGITFQVSSGEIFGLIGPDGAGKTTLIRMLTTLLEPSGGDAFINGWSIRGQRERIRAHIGYMPAVFSLYLDLTVEENLHFFATLFNTTIEDNYHLVKDIYDQIAPFRNYRASALSGGMKQKLALSCALIHSPLVLFLDEPTTGVDPVSRTELWGMLRRLSESGVTIVVSTAYMDEASLCDRVALFQEGRIIGIDTPLGIRAAYPRRLYSVWGDRMHQLLEWVRLVPFVASCIAFGDTHHVTLADGYGVEDLKFALRARGAEGVHVEEIEPCVEDAFMALTADIVGAG